MSEVLRCYYCSELTTSPFQCTVSGRDGKHLFLTEQQIKEKREDEYKRTISMGEDEAVQGSLQIVSEATSAIRNLLNVIWMKLPKESIENTPRRFIDALFEMTSGYNSSPEEVLGKVFEEPCDEIIIVRGIDFTSVCEHHLLPFTGTCDIGYIPGKVVGLSKLPRLVDMFSRRLQMQERMTRQIAESIMQYLNAEGAAVVTKASHSCMSCRGVRKDAEMVCSSMLGKFRSEPEARAEFLQLCKE